MESELYTSNYVGEWKLVMSSQSENAMSDLEAENHTQSYPVSPNTNIDELEEVFEVKLADNQKGYMWAKLSPKSKKKIEALITAARIDELRLLLSLNNEHITGDDIRERIKELEKS